MRKLMWFSIGFGAAITFGAYLLMGNILAILGIGFALVAVGAGILKRKVRWMRIPAVIALGCCVGFLWFWIFDSMNLGSARQLDGVTTKAVIEVTDYAFVNDYGVAVDGKASWNGQEYRLRLYLHEDVSLKPGDLVSGTYDFRITDKGGSRKPTFHRGNGIRLLAYQSGDVEILRGDGSWWQYPVSHLRHEMLSLDRKSVV